MGRRLSYWTILFKVVIFILSMPFFCSVQAVVELKNRPTMWHKARKVSLTAGQTEIKIEFPLPIVACNLMIEYADFYENIQGKTIFLLAMHALENSWNTHVNNSIQRDLTTFSLNLWNIYFQRPRKRFSVLGAQPQCQPILEFVLIAGKMYSNVISVAPSIMMKR